MRNDYYSNSKDYINRWVVSYADFITMLLALFMVMWATSGINNHNKENELEKNLAKRFPAYYTKTNVKISENIAKLPKTSKDSIPTVDSNLSEQDKILKKLEQNPTLKSKTKLLKSSKGAVIRLNDKMIFSEGSAIIKKDVLTTLDTIAKELATLDNYIIIEGHTDSTPIHTKQFPSNWELSTARATNIISYLVKNDGLNPKKLSAVGYGEYMPIAPNTTYEGKTINRRVDIIILSSDK